MSCCDGEGIQNCPEQSEFNCIPTHFASFCPPPCTKCNPCAPGCCDCPCLPECNPCCDSPCKNLYTRIKYLQGRMLGSNKLCCPPCDVTPKRREPFKPIYICKVPRTPLHYDTIYRRSFDVLNYNPPPY